jgi:superfamily II DNA or RNA helicase
MTTESIDLWTHQVQAIDGLRGKAKSGKRRTILQSPPGSGKTEIAVELIKSARQRDRKVAFTVPMLTLIDQTVARFIKRGVPMDEIGVMQANHPMTRIGAPIQVCSVQTLQKREFPPSNLILVDECHIRYDVIPEWMEARPDAYFSGLSATPWARGLGDYWEELLVVSTISELIETGVLTPFKTFCPLVRPNLKGVKTHLGDYAVGELGERMSEKRLIADVTATWLQKAERRPTLCYTVNKAHAALVVEDYRRLGVKAVYVDADVEREERSEYIEGLRTGDVEVLVSIGTMICGVDVPWCSCVQWVRPTKSPIMFVQGMTRGLRSYPGKQDCLFLDHSMSTIRLGQVTEIHYDKLRKGKEPDKADVEQELQTLDLPRECPQCHFIVPPRVYQCPNCGYKAARKCGIRCEDGELVELGALQKTPEQRNGSMTTPERRQVYAELLGYAEAMGWKPGWAARSYQEYFGVWPNAHGKHVQPSWPPSTDTALFIHERHEAYKRQQRRAAF